MSSSQRGLAVVSALVVLQFAAAGGQAQAAPAPGATCKAFATGMHVSTFDGGRFDVLAAGIFSMGET